MKFTTILLSALIAAPAAFATTITVPGTANPYFAGVPDGTTYTYPTTSETDSAPANAPVLVDGLTFGAGDTLNFTATGSTGNTPVIADRGPDGLSPISHLVGDLFGKSGLTAPINSLVAVFLDDSAPGTGDSDQPSLDFSSADSMEFAALSPELRQVFFIGDGMNSEGIRQSFIVPDGATRLFLGSMDGFGWFNNSGAFEVEVSKAPIGGEVPLPASGLLLLGGLGLLAWSRRA